MVRSKYSLPNDHSTNVQTCFISTLCKKRDWKRIKIKIVQKEIVLTWWYQIRWYCRYHLSINLWKLTKSYSSMLCPLISKKKQSYSCTGGCYQVWRHEHQGYLFDSFPKSRQNLTNKQRIWKFEIKLKVQMD